MDKKIYLIFLPVAALLVLGGLNVYHKVSWKEPWDGVTWEARAAGLTAIKVDAESPAYVAGIKSGDILYAINNNLIKNKINLAKNLWAAWSSDQKAIYQINRRGELIYPPLYLAQKGVNLLYFYLVLVGLTTLVISLIVILNSQKPLAMPSLSLSLISLVFYSFLTFSPTGKLDTLDSFFYWLDAIAFLVFPPLLLHFFTIFPQRKKFLKSNPKQVYYLYIPALLLLLAKAALHLPNLRNLDESLTLRIFDTLQRLDLVHFALFTLATFATVLHSTRSASNILVRKQSKWIANGVGFGMLPFTIFYIGPFLLGRVPSQWAELTVLFQALIPLTFAYSVSRYRIMDFEVLLKKAATLVVSYFVLACFYLVVSSQTKIFSENKLTAIILGALAIILGATLFTPLKKLFQTIFDRVFYRRSYKYRQTLLSISKELSRERNLQNLTQSLLELIAKALALRGIALLLPEQTGSSTFYIQNSRGELPSLPLRATFGPEVEKNLKEDDFISFYPFTEKKEPPPKIAELMALGFFQLLPLRVEDKLIGCLAMGKKLDTTFLTSEDWELLTTVSSPIALALENASLYSQASVRALELERLKDYSENIIESLTVGVAVLDQSGKIIGWNRVLEEIFDKNKNAVIGHNLADVLGRENFGAIFPSDSQQDYRLLSEIRLSLGQGEDRIFDIAKTPLLDNRLAPYGTIIVFEDITEKMRLQQQLVTSEKLASIGLLSAGVAHEINTPLTGISSYVQMLQKKLTDSHYTHILEKIEAQTDRVARIIKNLLNFARNPSESAFYRVDLKENLQEIIALIDYKLKTLNIGMELNLTDVQPLWAQGERLQQVFINIILNAIDAMPRGGSLRIDLAQQNAEVQVKIADSGTGIKSEHLPHIFDPFFTTKGMGKGTGLGLSISYAIIKEHEGDIAVESELGKGTCFTITIPADLDRREINQKSLDTGNGK